MVDSKSSHSQRYAAIDVGSNAVRLLIKELDWSAGKMRKKKWSLTTGCHSFGGEVFNSGQLSEAAMEDLGQVMKAFKLLMDVQGGPIPGVRHPAHSRKPGSRHPTGGRGLGHRDRADPGKRRRI